MSALQVGTQRGVLWVENMASVELDIERLQDDYGERVCRSVKRCLEKFCGEDRELLRHIIEHTHSMFGDGALQKSLSMLRVGLPHLHLVAKDTAHTIRIATGDPVKRDALLGEQWEQLMAAGGLVHTVLSSAKLQHALMACQKHLRTPNGMQTILRQIGHSDVRYESAAAAHRQYTNLQSAIALLLALRSQDPRLKKEDRSQAVAWLEAMGPASAVQAGLLDDWSAEALKLVRVNDVSDADPSLLRRHLDAYLDRLHVLFDQGRILLDAENNMETNIARSISNAREAPPIYYGHKIKYLWQEDVGAEEAVLALHHMREAARATKARLAAEYDESLLCDFEAFDLKRWHWCLRRATESQRLGVVNLTRRYKKLCKAFRLPVHLAEQECSNEIVSAAQHLVRSNPAAFQDDFAFDNRELWATFSNTEGVGAGFRFLPRVLEWYLSIEHVTSSVERGLGDVRRVADSHCGISELPLSDLSLLLIDGPRLKEDVVNMEDGVAKLTDWSRDWATLWVAKYGRRFCAYTRRHGPEPIWAKKKIETDTSIKESQDAARDSLCNLRNHEARQSKPILSLPRASIVEPVQVSKKTADFNKTTERRRLESRKFKEDCIQQNEPVLPDVLDAQLLQSTTTTCRKKFDNFSLAPQTQPKLYDVTLF